MASWRQVLFYELCELGLPPPSRKIRQRSAFEFFTANHIALAPSLNIGSFIYLDVTTNPLFINLLNWLSYTIFPNSPSRLLLFFACLIFNSARLKFSLENDV
jgi:hypothetical protein